MHRWLKPTIGGLVVVLAMGVGAIAHAVTDAPPPDGGGVHTATAPTYQPTNPELTFIPVTACVLVDTRQAGGQLGAGVARNYKALGNGSLASQGGSHTGCGLPTSASALLLNVGALEPHAGGYMKIKPFGASGAGAGAVNYLAHQNIGGVVTVPLNSPGTGNAFTVTNTGGPAGLIITVQGYYEKPLAGFVSPSGTPYSGSSRIISATRVALGVFEVRFDRNIRYCGATATAYVSSYYASATTWYDSTRPDTVRVNLWDSGGAAVDQYFYIQVSC